ncbi:MAG: nucleotidyltransferase family protein [Caldilineaceae bacterium]
MTSQRSLALIVLAAGRSSRMGRPKQLEVVDGEPMVMRAAKLALGCLAQQTILVTGAYAEQIEQILTPLPDRNRLTFVHNPHWQDGQSTSVHAAIQALKDEIEAVLFLPVDQPFVTPAFLHSIITAWQNGAALVAPQVNGEARGAPALFTRTCFPELLQIQGDVGGRVVLMKHRGEVTWLAAEAGILRDIDTPEDLKNEHQTRQT